MVSERANGERIILRGHPGVGQPVEAEALVCDDNFSARYDVNRRTGVFSRTTHALYGVSLPSLETNCSDELPVSLARYVTSSSFALAPASLSMAWWPRGMRMSMSR